MKILRLYSRDPAGVFGGIRPNPEVGMGSFANEKVRSWMAVDAKPGIQQLDQPYLCSFFYMAPRRTAKTSPVSRDDVAWSIRAEFHLPTVKEFRQNYNGEIKDLDFYRHLGKEGIFSSWIRVYTFPKNDRFLSPQLAGDVPRGRTGVHVQFHRASTPCFISRTRASSGGQDHDQGQRQEGCRPDRRGGRRPPVTNGRFPGGSFISKLTGRRL